MKSTAQVFRMREGLKLPDLSRIQAGEIPLPYGRTQYPGEELRLRAVIFGFQSSFLTGFLNGRKINVGGQVLFAWTHQQIVTDVVLMIGAKGAIDS